MNEEQSKDPENNAAPAPVHRVVIGQFWKRDNGVVYEVCDERGSFSRDVLLIPVEIPRGKKARRTWKWDKAVIAEMEFYR
jgi:hypothetical protein